MKVCLISLLVLVPSLASAQEFPIQANRITPSIMARLEHQYPKTAVDCLKSSLEEANASDHEYMLTVDYPAGQLWLLSLDTLERDDVPLYICTPDGLVTNAQPAMEAIAKGSGS